jgi:glycosyltransferase involved in cell wall biosynthesis
MIIAVDAYEASAPDRVGVGRFAHDLICALHEITAEKDKFSFRLFTPFTELSVMPRPSNRWQYVKTRSKAVWTFWALPKALARESLRPSVVFSPTHYIPRFTNLPRVAAVMDLSYLHYPQMFKLGDLYKLVFWTAYSIRNARHVITISQASRDAIIDTYGIMPERVSVVYPGLNRVFSINDMIRNDIFSKYQISRNYILAVGTIQPRKNYERLIAAFTDFLAVNRQRFRDLNLVIAGKPGWMYEPILAAPAKFGITDRVKFLSFVSDNDLAALYTNALCLAMPSLYEGFGLPVLEAMAYGCPVVVSRVSSLPEIAGKAAIYVDPTDVKSISHGLLAAVRERNLMQGRYRIKYGRERIKDFTWEKSARVTLDILMKTAGVGSNK